MDTVKFSFYLPYDYNNNEIEEMLFEIKKDFHKNNIKIVNSNFEKRSLSAFFTLTFINNPEMITGSLGLSLMLLIVEKYFGEWLKQFSLDTYNYLKSYTQNKLLKNINKKGSISEEIPNFFDLIDPTTTMRPPINGTGDFSFIATLVSKDDRYIYTTKIERNAEIKQDGVSFIRKEKQQLKHNEINN